MTLDLQKWSRENWDKLHPIVREDCLGQLRADLPGLLIDHWREQRAGDTEIGSDDLHFHHGTGMLVRNILRKVITDGELPGVEYPAQEGQPSMLAKNWDDYYMGALDALAEAA